MAGRIACILETNISDGMEAVQGSRALLTTRNAFEQLVVSMFNLTESAMNRFRGMLDRGPESNCQSLHAHTDSQNGELRTSFQKIRTDACKSRQFET